MIDPLFVGLSDDEVMNKCVAAQGNDRDLYLRGQEEMARREYQNANDQRKRRSYARGQNDEEYQPGPRDVLPDPRLKDISDAELEDKAAPDNEYNMESEARQRARTALQNGKIPNKADVARDPPRDPSQRFGFSHAWVKLLQPLLTPSRVVKKLERDRRLAATHGITLEEFWTSMTSNSTNATVSMAIQSSRGKLPSSTPALGRSVKLAEAPSTHENWNERRHGLQEPTGMSPFSPTPEKENIHSPSITAAATLSESMAESVLENDLSGIDDNAANEKSESIAAWIQHGSMTTTAKTRQTTATLTASARLPLETPARVMIALANERDDENAAETISSRKFSDTPAKSAASSTDFSEIHPIVEQNEEMEMHDWRHFSERRRADGLSKRPMGVRRIAGWQTSRSMNNREVRADGLSKRATSMKRVAGCQTPQSANSEPAQKRSYATTRQPSIDENSSLIDEYSAREHVLHSQTIDDSNTTTVKCPAKESKTHGILSLPIQYSMFSFRSAKINKQHCERLLRENRRSSELSTNQSTPIVVSKQANKLQYHSSHSSSASWLRSARETIEMSDNVHVSDNVQLNNEGDDGEQQPSGLLQPSFFSARNNNTLPANQQTTPSANPTQPTVAQSATDKTSVASDPSRWRPLTLDITSPDSGVGAAASGRSLHDMLPAECLTDAVREALQTLETALGTETLQSSILSFCDLVKEPADLAETIIELAKREGEGETMARENANESDDESMAEENSEFPSFSAALENARNVRDDTNNTWEMELDDILAVQNDEIPDGSAVRGNDNISMSNISNAMSLPVVFHASNEISPVPSSKTTSLPWTPLLLISTLDMFFCGLTDTKNTRP